MTPTKAEAESIFVSRCCKAEIEYGGGGYGGDGYDDGEICPVTDECSKCHQLLAINGDSFRIELHNPETWEVIKKGYSVGKTIIKAEAKE